MGKYRHNSLFKNLIFLKLPFIREVFQQTLIIPESKVNNKWKTSKLNYGESCVSIISSTRLLFRQMCALWYHFVRSSANKYCTSITLWLIRIV